MQHSKRRNMASPPVSPAPDFASKYEHKFDDLADGDDAMDVSFGEGEMGGTCPDCNRGSYKTAELLHDSTCTDSTPYSTL